MPPQTALTPAALQDLLRRHPHLRTLTKPRLNKYIPHAPTAPQAAFLLLDHVREVLYGGAAGGGKSDALLMAALQYVDQPNYAALLLRKTFSDLNLEGALIPRSKEWLMDTDASWSEKERKWTFPSGAVLAFGYAETKNDIYRYQGSEWQFIGVDELTQWEEFPYRYLFSRTRRLEGSTIPVRVRSASNPGGIGHDWVRHRFFVEGKRRGRLFIPAKLADNPHLDQEEYRASLLELDAVTRNQLLAGDWNARPSGGKFKRQWFPVLDIAPYYRERTVRFWDLAASEPSSSEDPDYTVGVKMGWTGEYFVILDMVKVQARPAAVEQIIRHTAQLDGIDTAVRMYQDPGQAGLAQIDHYSREVLRGWDFRGVKMSGNKEIWASPLSAHAERGEVRLVRGPWNSEWLDEVELFPLGNHDDVIDASAGALHDLAQPLRIVQAAAVPGFGKVGRA